MGRILTIYNTVNVSANINAWHLRTSKPELCSRVRWRGAAKSGVTCTVMTKVVFVIYSSRLSVKFTTSWVAKPAVRVQSVSVRVRSENCAVGALISTNVDKLRENTEVMCWRLHKKIQTFYRNFPVIPVVHPICRKITSGSPVSGDQFRLTSYGTSTDGSYSIQVYFGWLAGRTGRMVCLWRRHCFGTNGTGSESMPYQSRNQSRNKLGTKCCFGQQCCRYHWIWFSQTTWRLCMISAGAQFDTWIHWNLLDMCSWIFSLWRHTLHDTCLHVDRGWTHSTCYDKFDQNRFYED